MLARTKIDWPVIFTFIASSLLLFLVLGLSYLFSAPPTKPKEIFLIVCMITVFPVITAFYFRLWQIPNHFKSSLPFDLMAFFQTLILFLLVLFIHQGKIALGKKLTLFLVASFILSSIIPFVLKREFAKIIIERRNVYKIESCLPYLLTGSIFLICLLNIYAFFYYQPLVTFIAEKFARDYLNPSLIFSVFFSSALIVWYRQLTKMSKYTFVRWIILFSPILAIDVNFQVSWVEYGDILENSNALLAGRLPFFEIFAQYGPQFIFYSIPYTFLPRNYANAAVLTWIFLLIHYFIFVKIAYDSVKNKFFVIPIIFTIFLFHTMYPYTITMTPPVTMIRYMPASILLFALLKSSHGKYLSSPMALFAILLATLWNIESLGACLAMIFSAVLARALWFRRLKGCTLDLIRATIAATFPHILYSGLTFLKRGKFPDYATYFEYIGSYVDTKHDIGWLALNDQHFFLWLPIFLLYGLMITAFIYYFTTGRRNHWSGTVYRFLPVVAYSVCSLYYYFNRSLPELLFLSMLPPIMLIVIFFEKHLSSRIRFGELFLTKPSNLVFSISFVLLCTLIIALPLNSIMRDRYVSLNTQDALNPNSMLITHLSRHGISDLYDRWQVIFNEAPEKYLHHIRAATLRRNNSAVLKYEYFSEERALVNKYFGSKKEILLFPVSWDVYYFLSGKINAIPFVTTLKQNAFSPTLWQKILTYTAEIPAGQILIVTKDCYNQKLTENTYANEDAYVVKKILEAKSPRLMEETKFFKVFRLEEKKTI